MNPMQKRALFPPVGGARAVTRWDVRGTDSFIRVSRCCLPATGNISCWPQGVWPRARGYLETSAAAMHVIEYLGNRKRYDVMTHNSRLNVDQTACFFVVVFFFQTALKHFELFGLMLSWKISCSNQAKNNYKLKTKWYWKKCCERTLTANWYFAHN